MTDGKQRTNKRVGISYDYMDKLNKYVKAGIFVDKNKDGFTKAEQRALGEEFIKLHNERGDSINFKRMIAGKSFEYKDEEFIRLAQAAGYVLAEQPDNVEQTQTDKIEEVQKTKAPEEKTTPPEKTSVETTKQTEELTVSEKEIAVLNQELDEMKSTWTEKELFNPSGTLTNMIYKIAGEIRTLEKDYTTETVTKKRLFRKDKTETVRVPKTEEQKEADKIEIEKKKAELDKIAKLRCVESLYSSDIPTKYAGYEDDKFIKSIVTTKDGRKLGVASVKKLVYDELYGHEIETYVDEYYPISLKKFEEREGNYFPQYYYRVDKDEKAVQGKIELKNGKIVQE